MKKAVFEDISEYVLKRQNTVAQYIEMLPIMDLCQETVQIPGTWLTRRRWKQEGPDLATSRVATETVEYERGKEDPRR